jgi:hypothetical protein
MDDSFRKLDVLNGAEEAVGSGERGAGDDDEDEEWGSRLQQETKR